MESIHFTRFAFDAVFRSHHNSEFVTIDLERAIYPTRLRRQCRRQLRLVAEATPRRNLSLALNRHLELRDSNQMDKA
jgi:plasmid maintenance system killer protein